MPPAVAETHAALLAAAESGDYEALRPLIPDEFSYTFGLPAEGGPIAYWQQVEAESGESPIEILARILALPYTLSAGTYVWPFAYDKQEAELTDYERSSSATSPSTPARQRLPRLARRDRARRHLALLHRRRLEQELEGQTAQVATAGAPSAAGPAPSRLRRSRPAPPW